MLIGWALRFKICHIIGGPTGAPRVFAEPISILEVPFEFPVVLGLGTLVAMASSLAYQFDSRPCDYAGVCDYAGAIRVEGYLQNQGLFLSWQSILPIILLLVKLLWSKLVRVESFVLVSNSQ